MAKDKLYIQIANYLKERITSGELKIGDAVYSENLLCEKFKVSRTSVRKAIRLMIEENLLVSRQGKGTFIKAPGNGVLHNAVCLVNHWSRGLRYDVADSYYSRIIYSTEGAVREHDMEFQIFSRVAHTPEELVNRMKKLKFDGLLVDGNYQDYFSDLEFLRRISPHVVLVDGCPAETGLPSMAPDTEGGYRQLLQLAAERNRPILFLYHEHQALHRHRAEGFRRAAAALNLEYRPVNYGENIGYDNFYAVGEYRLDHYPLIYQALKPYLGPETVGGTILCSCDYVAAKVIQILARNGFQAPLDYGVAGFGGLELSALAPTGVTTCLVDSERLGALAVDYLWDLIHAGWNQTEPVRFLPTTLLRRNSL